MPDWAVFICQKTCWRNCRTPRRSLLRFGELIACTKLYRHFYLMGGYGLEVNSDILLVPSVLLKTTMQGSFQMDLTAKAFFYQDYWAGITFRTNSALILMGGLKVDKFFFGYSIDFSFSSMRSYSYGTHEIVVVVKLGDNARRHKWINRF